MSTSRSGVLVLILTLTGISFSYGQKPANSSSAGTPRVQKFADVNEARLTTEDEKDPGDWLSYGRTYNEQRFSPLKQINDKNIAQLKPAWQFELNATRGEEGTPLVVDGVMYVATAYSQIFALDARTGAKLWSYDPKAQEDWSVNSCCGPINRGVAVWNGKVYDGTLDGHLIALDAKSGKVVWDTYTFPSDIEYDANGTPRSQYTTDGAPRVVKGIVIFGTSGGDKGVRGFISGFNAETGKLVWRFYTVPGDPAKPFENAAMEKAAKTWNGQAGGGGATWDSTTYDPDLDLLYFGTGNPTGRQEGDRLYGDSIMAIRPETGEYVWHYQEVPNDAWDYDSIPQITLADIKIDGRIRKVLLHAPKNGFFYVLDRATGELISAAPLFKEVNWASAIDLKTGRPIEIPGSRDRTTPDGKIFGPNPGTLGGHAWEAMSYSPLTGLAYVPILDAVREQNLTPDIEKEMKADPTTANLPDWKFQDEVIARELKHYEGHMVAWDPVTEKEVWRANTKSIWQGGTVATAGNLVFQGNALGELKAFQADTGKELWSLQVQTPIIAPPITYTVAGEQYVAVQVGWGGSMGLTYGPIGGSSHIHKNLPRVLAFKLNGNFALPTVADIKMPPLNPPPDTTTDAQVADGKAQYQRCARCHGARATSPGDVVDLRYSALVYDRDLLSQVLRKGILRSVGMPTFGHELSDEAVDAIRLYIIHEANNQVQRDKAQAAAK